MRFADLDGVTLDVNGTLLALIDPLPALQQLLHRHGIGRGDEQIRRAFAAEADFYRAQAMLGRDEASLADLRERCAAVFLEALGIAPAPDSFAAGYVAALRFGLLPGIEEALLGLRGRGLELAVISNWDIGLHEHLASLGVGRYFRAIVTSAESATAKPDPSIFLATLEQIGVEPARALHVGDEVADEEGAQAAGMRFAPAPLVACISRLA